MDKSHSKRLFISCETENGNKLCTHIIILVYRYIGFLDFLFQENVLISIYVAVTDFTGGICRF